MGFRRLVKFWRIISVKVICAVNLIGYAVKIRDFHFVRSEKLETYMLYKMFFYQVSLEIRDFHICVQMGGSDSKTKLTLQCSSSCRGKDAYDCQEGPKQQQQLTRVRIPLPMDTPSSFE